MYYLNASVPELASVWPPTGLPPVTRQRLQWASSVEVATTRSHRGDLWLFNHLAGGPCVARARSTHPQTRLARLGSWLAGWTHTCGISLLILLCNGVVTVGRILEALESNGHANAANIFRACKHNSDKRKARCYNASVESVNVTLQPWHHVLARVPIQRGSPTAATSPRVGGSAPAGGGGGGIDLLVLTHRDPGVTALLKAFPFNDTVPSPAQHPVSPPAAVASSAVASSAVASPAVASPAVAPVGHAGVRPSLIYYRTSAGSGVRRLLLSTGYETSAHWETSAWGENTLAWRADRCDHASSGMGGKPAWSTVAANLPMGVRDAADVPAERKRARRGRVSGRGRRLRRDGVA